MSELRLNLITRDWVVIATERAKRPHEFAQSAQQSSPLPEFRLNCPFCVGNECLEQKEVLRLMGQTGWQVRVVPNKYPALSNEEDRTRSLHGNFQSMVGFGVHEVVIEHPRHDLIIARMSVADINCILQVYRQRYAQIRLDPRIEAIILFKNHGAKAGTSLEHPHSQIVATPIVPHQLRNRLAEAMRYFDDCGECLFCQTMKDELESGQRIVCETEHFVAFIPFAALSPFHTWIFPRRHMSSYDETTDAELSDLALILRNVMAKLYYGLNNPDYNYTIRSVPTREQYTEYFHWYLAIVPRVSNAAGFELGSGMYINTALPEESAAFLRAINIEYLEGCEHF